MEHYYYVEIHIDFARHYLTCVLLRSLEVLNWGNNNRNLSRRFIVTYLACH